MYFCSLFIITIFQLHLTFAICGFNCEYMLPLARLVCGPLHKSVFGPCAMILLADRADGLLPLASPLLPAHKSGFAPFHAT